MILSPPLRTSLAVMVSLLVLNACGGTGGTRAGSDGAATSADASAMPDSSEVAIPACSAGEFTSGVGQARSCLPCPAGTFSTVANSSECRPWTDCAPGQLVAQNGSATADRTCTACPNGEYSAMANATACTAFSVCAPGTFVSTAATAERDRVCVACQSGHFSATENADACTPWQDCAAGAYVSNMPTASTDRVCQTCPSATYTSQANQALCLPQNACPAGTEQTSPATAMQAASCVACPAGTHCAGGTTPKQTCAGDTWDNDQSSATPCVPKTTCGPGFYAAGAGSGTTDRTCSPCASGTFSAGNNAGSCSPWSTCPVGSLVTSGGSATADRACDTCPTGQFSAATNATACTAWSDCAAGTYVSTLPTKDVDRSCTACAAGTFSDTVNAASCQAWRACSPGQYVTGTGTAASDRPCAPCAAGSFSTAANANSCTAMTTCNPGQYISTAGTAATDRACSACAAGSVSLVSNVAACQPLAQTLTAGRDHTCAVRAGAVRCWGAGILGYPGQGVIGDGEAPSSVGDIQVGGVVEAVAAGGFHTCALLSGGKVRCWGDNARGPLGYGYNIRLGDDETPAGAGDVDVGATVTQLAGGLYHTCAVITGGQVRCWGDNGSGQLGYGHINRIGDDEVPASAGNVDVGGTVVHLAAGHEHTCAVLSGGQVRCWGENGSGQLGYGHTNRIGDDETPASAGNVDVGGAVVQLTAGAGHTCALLATGKVRCWGRNNSGQLGYGNITKIGDDETPASAGDVDVGGPVAKISAGEVHTCALLADGNVRCWGWNYHGELGYGHRDDIGDNEPPASAGNVNVGGTVMDIAAGLGGLHTCVRLTDGHVRCWGIAGSGQLGYGNTNPIGDDETPASAGNVDW